MIILAVIAPFFSISCPKNMENEETVHSCFKFKDLIVPYNLHFNCTKFMLV